MVSWDFDIVASLLEHQIVIRYLAPRSRRGMRTSPEGRSSCVPACTASRRGAAPAWWPQDLEKHRLSNIPLRSSSAAVMQRLLAHAGGNRCYGRPGDSCSLLSNRSSCSRPLLLWCRCRRSGRSGNGCATRGPIGPGPPHLCEWWEDNTHPYQTILNDLEKQSVFIIKHIVNKTVME